MGAFFPFIKGFSAQVAICCGQTTALGCAFRPMGGVADDAVGSDVRDLAAICICKCPAGHIQGTFCQHACRGKSCIGRAKDTACACVHLDRFGPIGGSDEAGHDSDALPFQRAGHRTDPHPPISGQSFCTRRHEDVVNAGLDQRAPEQRKFTVIANQNTDFAQIRVEHHKGATGCNCPWVAFKQRHDLLVLRAAFAIGRDQTCPVDGPVRVNICVINGRRGRQDMQVMLRGKPGEQRVALRDMRADGAGAGLQIAGCLAPVQSGQLERALVGTIYVQDSPFRARKIGAALLARNVAAHLDGPLAQKDGAWRPLIYCWRGGQRSGGVTSILSQIGWRAERITGGYKSYRKQVVAALYEAPVPHRVILLDGNTGSGKTAVLHALAARGVQVIDLEGMAAHKGSLLGAMIAEQPSQKMFESRLAGVLARLDPARPVVMEAESSKVGERLIPASVWKAMQSAPRIVISAKLEDRATFLAQDYADVLAKPGVMADRLERLRPLCGHAQVADWLDMLRGGAHQDLASSLMQVHYDPGYRRSRGRTAFDILAQLDAPSLSAQGIDALAGQIAGLLDQI